MAVKGILTIIHEYGTGTADDDGQPQPLRLMMRDRDRPDITGVWVQAGATDWICTTDRRYWLRMADVAGFEVVPRERP